MTAQIVTPDVHLNIHKFTTKQYQLMCESGIFAVGDRYELINEKTRKMSLIGLKYAVCVAKATRYIQIKLRDRAFVWTQNPILISNYS